MLLDCLATPKSASHEAKKSLVRNLNVPTHDDEL